MDNNEREAMNETIAKLDKQNKEYKKRMSKQTLMTVCMICVSIFVITVATYAWYLITNTPRVTKMEFKADTLGDLKIAQMKSDGSGPDTFENYIELGQDDAKLTQYLSPVTTKNGTTFFRPLYHEGKVVDVKEFGNTDADNKLLHTKYVFEKTFYLKAGNDTVSGEAPKYYDIYLVGKTSTANLTDSGSYLYTGTYSSTAVPTDGDAANSVRVSFEFAKENTYTAVSSGYESNSNNIVKIYEPNCDIHNTSENRATVEISSDATNKPILAEFYNSDSQKLYTTMKQNADKSFDATQSDSESGERSEKLCTIKENEAVKVIMRIWIEGSDPDCVNEIAADKIAGQIQFISEENFH